MLIPFSEIISRHNIHPESVIHVGGHYGEEAKDYHDNGIKKSLWIEANPDCISELNLALAPYPNTFILNACVSDTDGQEINLNISNNEGQSSSILELEYHKIAHKEVFYTHSIPVVTSKLDTKINQFERLIKDVEPNFKWNNIFLNADIQGAELLMLKGATELLSNPNLICLYLEVNQKELYKGCGLVEEIDEFLRPYKFYRVETKWCGETGWGDAVYLKDFS
jgi:FkbM family methyltransferase